MKEFNNFFTKYKSDFKKHLSNGDSLITMNKIVNIFTEVKKKNKKILIFGNGGSASIASHFSVDLTKIAKIRCVNFNEANLITCFANDYKFENWVSKTIEFYADKGDVIILISSSGTSKNMINASLYARKKKNKIITFTGFKKSNPLSKKGDVNIWVNSSRYNIVENVHQFLLLSTVDFFNLKNKLNNE